MKTFAVLAVLAVARVNAQTPSSPSGSSTATRPSSSGTGSVIPTASQSTAPTGSFSFSLRATNPTAVPLASIRQGAPSAVTKPLTATPSPGAKPSDVSKAPGLPDASVLRPADYPTLDRPPPVDSPEVRQWIEEVKASGVEIPGFASTVAGGCASNPDAIADETNRCWWTCSGCTKETDVTTCPNKLTWGLTYDDGPSPYTTQLLEYLDSANLKATFFVVGSRCISYPQILQAEYLAGHQIAVHTWSHASLTLLSNEQIIAELGWTKKIIKDVLGVTPTHMRPPFGDIDNRVRAISRAMGLTPVMWTRLSPVSTFNTQDFDINGGLAPVGLVLQNWQYILGNATQLQTGFIALQHDLFQQSVQVATGYITPDALAHDPPFKIQPVIECLGQDNNLAYVETGGSGNGTNGGNGGGNAGNTGGNSALSLKISSVALGALTVIFGFAVLL